MSKNLLLTLIALITFSLWSCSNEKESFDIVGQPKEVTSFLALNYPEAKQLKWNSKDDLIVLNFINNDKKVSAWLKSGSVAYIMTDLTFSELPKSVMANFNASISSDWSISKIDKITDCEFETCYHMELAKDGEDEVLLYEEDGSIVDPLFAMLLGLELEGWVADQ